MKILIYYLRPYKWLVALSLLLASINQVFSLLDPLIFGKIIDRFANNPKVFEQIVNGQLVKTVRTESEFITGVLWLLFLAISVAMVSRIAKAFQDYFSSVVIQKFGANIFTVGLRHSMRLPYQEFEDQRSGETLSILTKVRADTEKFISAFINVVFGIVVGLVFVSVYAFNKHWAIIPVYLIWVFIVKLAYLGTKQTYKSYSKKILCAKPQHLPAVLPKACAILSW